MRQKLFLLTFIAGMCSSAVAQVQLDPVPFSKRFPSESIKSEQRADEVIAAYEKEIKTLEQWKKQEDRLCFKKFFVNSCLIDNSRLVREKKADAKAVWLHARDFVRQKKSSEARKNRLAKEEERKEWVNRQEQIIKNPQAARKISDEPDADIDLSGVQTVDSRTPRPGAPKKQSSGLSLSKPREITPEQQAENQKNYEEKQIKREERIADREANPPSPPSEDLAQREAQREERRKLAAQRKLENAKKRAAKAAEYEKQVRMREEQQGLVKDLKP